LPRGPSAASMEFGFNDLPPTSAPEATCALISSSDSASSAKAAVVLPLKGRFCEQDQLFAGVGAAVRQVIIAAVPVRNLHCAPILGPFISDNPVNAGCGMRAHRLQS
jgi:hypothetical protein